MQQNANKISLAKIPDLIGQELGTSHWFTITQEDIDCFARLTRDLDQMHIDPVWAKTNSPYRGTIAFGFQTLSLLTSFMHEILPWPDEVKYGLNYGFDKVRFLEPVPAGSRIRARMKLLDFSPAEQGRYRVRMGNTIEIEGIDKPALVADWTGLLITQ